MGLSQPPSCFEIGCPLAGVAHGFVLGYSDPKKARLSIIFEAPWRDEIVARVEDEEELRRRKRDFSGIPDAYLSRGIPVSGPSGSELFGWALAPFGLGRDDVFVDNTLRCAMSLKEPLYPTGDIRKRAEACCRQYDRIQADIALVSIHPAAIHRDPAPLPMQLKSFEKALDFEKQGYKVVVLAGGKAADWWFGSARNPMRWMLHYEFNDDRAKQRLEARRLKGLEVVVGQKKAKKLTARTALAVLVANVKWGDGELAEIGAISITKPLYDAILPFTQTKPKKTKLASLVVE